MATSSRLQSSEDHTPKCIWEEQLIFKRTPQNWAQSVTCQDTLSLVETVSIEKKKMTCRIEINQKTTIIFQNG